MTNKIANALLKGIDKGGEKKKQTKITMAKAMSLLFEDYIDKAGFELANTMEFREKYLYFNKVNIYFERNKKIF